MAEYLIQDKTLTEIADAIRTKSGTVGRIAVSEMAPMILALEIKSNSLPVLDGTLPEDITASIGTSVTFTISVSDPVNPEEYTCQWYYDNTAVSGATSLNYTRIIELGEHKVYCIVTNEAGSSASRTATIVGTAAYLYNNGTHNTSLTGGFTTTAMKMSSSAANTGAPTVTFGTSTMVITHTKAGSITSGLYKGGLARTKSKIDCSNYNKLIVVGTISGIASGSANVSMWSSMGTYQSDNRVKYQTLSNGDVSISMDISDLTGSYYIGFGFNSTYGNIELTINSLRFE